MERRQKKPGLDAVLAVWSRRKWLAVPVAAATLAAVVSTVTFLPSIYRSSATILVERQQVPEEFVRSTVTSAVENRLQTITQEILSRSRLIELIDRFGLYTDLKRQAPLEEVIERMRQDIAVEPKGIEQKGSNRVTIAFAISYTGSDPQKVAVVTNTLASFYIEENLKARERQATGTAEFLRVQLEETKKRLDDQEGQVSQFKRAHIGELPEQMQANLSTLERLNAQHRLNSENQTRAIERRTALVKQLADGDPTGLAGSPDAAEARITKLKQELAELRARFSDKYPDVVRLKVEIAALEEQLSRTKDETEPAKGEAVPQSAYSRQLKKAIGEVEAEISALKAEEQSLRRAIAAYQQRVENTPRREQEFQGLSRDYEATKGLYHSLLKRYEEAKLAESMEQRQKGEQFRILDPATASEQPAAPKRPQLLLLGVLLSLGLAAGSVIMAEQLDTSFHTVDDLRASTRVPVLVSIPRIVTEADTRRTRRRFLLGATTGILVLMLIVGSSYFIAKGNERLAARLSPSQFSKR